MQQHPPRQRLSSNAGVFSNRELSGRETAGVSSSFTPLAVRDPRSCRKDGRSSTKANAISLPSETRLAPHVAPLVQLLIRN